MIPGARDLLLALSQRFQELNSQVVAEGLRVPFEWIGVRPRYWVDEKHLASALPALILWEDSQALQLGASGGYADREINLVITILYAPTSEDYALLDSEDTADGGIWGLGSMVERWILENKNIAGEGTGFDLPFNWQSLEWRAPALNGVANSVRLTYRIDNASTWCGYRLPEPAQTGLSPYPSRVDSGRFIYQNEV